MASKYLDFRLQRDTGKTKTFGIYSRIHGDRLGTIHWYIAWRQYVLSPELGTIWNKGCLQDINGFIDGLMRERREARAAVPSGGTDD